MYKNTVTGEIKNCEPYAKGSNCSGCDPYDDNQCRQCTWGSWIRMKDHDEREKRFNNQAGNS